jgi:hypothetical protein
MQPRFPLYIPSKGRFDSRITMKALDRMGLDYLVIVEEQELARYAEHIDRAKLLVLDPAYQRSYDTFSDLGAAKGTGSGPARNFAWDHSISRGFDRHWIMDDNIRNFYRLNQNTKIVFADGVCFRIMEDFVLRYENVGMAGPNYEMFAPRKTAHKPFTVNTRIYSCNLIRNDLPLRWRGRYNEDTDLSLRPLKAGWCTVLFNAVLQDKVGTQRVPGGNEEIYSIGTHAKSQMLVDMHPDVTKLAWKFNRAHHHVDYSAWKSMKLIRRPDVEVAEGVYEYGMRLVKLAR